MITRKEKLLWLGFGLVLVLLFLLSSTDLIIKEEERRIYPVSVIVEDSSDKNYVNFRKGMELAAIELNADISFITLYEAGSLSQQQGLVLREQQAGAAALVVAPVKGEGAVERLREAASIPTVMVWTESRQEEEAAVTADFSQMGLTMARHIAQSYDKDIPAYLMGKNWSNQGTGGFESALAAALKEQGFQVRPAAVENGTDCRAVLEAASEREKKGAVIVGLEPDALEMIADLLQSDESLRSFVRGLYGRGSTLAILNALDEGVIRGICFTDEFSAGYLSLRNAVNAAAGESREEKIVLDHYYIEKEDLREPQYEKMLYPIE